MWNPWALVRGDEKGGWSPVGVLRRCSDRSSRRTDCCLPVALMLLCCLPAFVSAGEAPKQTDRIEQWGISFVFDKPYTCGQFANGDYWVKGPVQIVAMTPDYDGEKNGWEVNPRVQGPHGLDGRIPGFDAGLVPELPFTGKPGQSILKALSNETPGPRREKLKTAAVLTVVDQVPPEGGATVFRPPYVAKGKPFYRVDDLRTELLPSLPKVPQAENYPLSRVVGRFGRVQLDHKTGLVGRRTHPRENIPDYGGDIGARNGTGALRLMLDDPVQDKMPALIAYVQYGIDLYHMYLDGQRWPSGGGHRPGQKIALVFAAVMLDDRDMIESVTNMTAERFLSEDTGVYWSQKANDGKGMVLFGVPGSEASYWTYLIKKRGNRSIRDPYGYIDGGECPSAYQVCCLSQPWKGQVLAVHLMPELKPVWNNQLVIDYIDRWVTHGTWALPDPIALKDPGTYNGQGVPGHGRFPEKHGTQKDGGGRRSRLADEMWTAYRNRTSAPVTSSEIPPK